MRQTETGIWELKSNLSIYLRLVKAGETVIITERGRPIGRIVPVTESVEERLERLTQAGVLAWNGHSLAPSTPPGQAAADQTIGDLLLEQRE